jgi:hypothetical protein
MSRRAKIISLAVVAGTAFTALAIWAGRVWIARQRSESILVFHSGANAVTQIQYRHREFQEACKPLPAAEPGDKARLKEQLWLLECDVDERRSFLTERAAGLKGSSVQPLLDACLKHVEVQEKVWLVEMKRILGKMDLRPEFIRREYIGAINRCLHAEKYALRDLQTKLLAFEKEFEDELKSRHANLVDPMPVKIERSDEAFALAAQFSKALTSEDVDALMKITATLWNDKREADKLHTAAFRAQLRGELQDFARRQKERGRADFQPEEAVAPNIFLSHFGFRLRDHGRWFFEEALNDDLVVHCSGVAVNHNETVVLLIRWMDGQPKVVGLLVL